MAIEAIVDDTSINASFRLRRVTGRAYNALFVRKGRRIDGHSRNPFDLIPPRAF